MLKLIVVFAILMSSAWSYDLQKLRNTKEAVSHNFSNKSFEKYRDITNSSTIIEDESQNLSNTLDQLSSRNDFCELSTGNTLISNSKVKDINQIVLNYKVLRANNIIDDLMLDIIKRSLNTSDGIRKIEEKYKPSNQTLNIIDIESVDENNFKLKAFYELQTMFTSDGSCLNENWNNYSYFTLKHLQAKKHQKQDQKRLISMALKEGYISRTTTKKLLYLVSKKIGTWKINLKKYLNIIHTVKDVYSIHTSDYSDPFYVKNKFTTKHYEKLKKISRRKELYKNFSVDQIMMMAQLMKRVNIRMSLESYITSPSVMISYSYTDTRTGDIVTEESLLSYEDQINWARRMLRQDMDKLRNSRFFKNSYVSYENIITSAVETGVINIDEISYVVSYDDLWNPHVKPWHKIRRYLVGLGGTLTIFLPPPFNIVGSLGLVLVQAQIEMKEQSHRDNTHANKVIN